jgi:hypothetical protein
MNKWQKQYENLPKWLKDIIDCFKDVHGYGIGRDDISYKYTKASVMTGHEAGHEILKGFMELKEFSDALTAPINHKVKNDCSADVMCQYMQPVCGGILCLCDEWPDKPHDCNRTWDSDSRRTKNCPGFYPNINYKDSSLLHRQAGRQHERVLINKKGN